METITKFECDCINGTTELVCDESILFDVKLIDGKLEVEPSDMTSGFENFRCTHCGFELDKETCQLEINYNG